MSKLNQDALKAAIDAVYQAPYVYTHERLISLAIEAYLRALPEPEGVKVRIAAVTDGERAEIFLIDEDFNEEKALNEAEAFMPPDGAYPYSRSIITAYLPLPQPPAEIAGEVEEA